MRGAQIGNILADNAMRAQQIGIQRDQQNAEMAMRQQAAEQAAQRFAAEQAQRAEEMELKKALAQTEQAKDAAQLIQSANEEQRKAQEAANRLMAQANYLKDQDGMKYLMRTAPAAAAQLQGSQLTATQRAAAASQKMKFDEEQKRLDRLLKEKLAVPNPDTTESKKTAHELNKIKLDEAKADKARRDEPVKQEVERLKNEIREDEEAIKSDDKHYGFGNFSLRETRLAQNRIKLQQYLARLGEGAQTQVDPSKVSEKHWKFNTQTGKFD